jgi:outer membrane lipoprotein carrier protein
MISPIVSLYAPSLWFISIIGLAQFNEPPKSRDTSTPATNGSSNTSSEKVTIPKKNIENISRSKGKFAKSPPRTNQVNRSDNGLDSQQVQDECPDDNASTSKAFCAIRRLQKVYQDAVSVTGNFKQTYTYAIYNRTQHSTGKVFLKKPGKMRWDYLKPNPKVFVSNSQDLWVYEPSKNQAHKKNLADSELPIAISFLMGKGNLLDEFEAKLNGPAKNNQLSISLSPKTQNRNYKSLELLVETERFMVLQTIVFDPAGNKNTITFSELKLNTAVSDAAFNFTPPPGVEIL